MLGAATGSGAKTAVSIAAAPYPESPHPYPNSFDFTWSWQSGTGAAFLDVTFDPLTQLGPGDFLYVMDNFGVNIAGSPFTGASLAGATKRIPGSNLQIRLTSDASGTAYGYRITNINPLDIPAPDLVISKTHEGTFAVGQVGAKYYLFVRNLGTGPTTDTVVVSDQLPQGLVANSMTGDGWTCVQPAGPCQRSDVLPNRGSYPPIYVDVAVTPQPARTIINTARVSGGGDSNTGNNTAEDPTDIESKGPDLRILKSHNGNFSQGQVGAFYTLVITNVGQGPTNGVVTVSDTVPAGLTPTGIAGAGWICTQPAGPCTRSDSLPNGATYSTLTMTVNVASTAASNIINVASISGGGDGDNTNNTASDPTVVGVLTCDPLPESQHPYLNNLDFTWTCVVPNAQSVDVTFDPLTSVENAADFIYITDANGQGIPGSPFTGTSLAGKTKNVPGNTVKIRLVTNAQNTDYGLKVTNIAPGVVATTADLTLSKTHTVDFYQGHIGAQYTILVRNVGTGNSSGQVSVNDVVPSGMTATAIAGTGWTCTQPAGPCTRSDVLAANASYPPITVTVNVAGNAPASLTNTATVSGGGDTAPNNNTATDPTVISPQVPFCSPAGLPESGHPYDNGVDQSWTCRLPGNPVSLNVTFDPSTSLDSSDLLYVMDANGNNIPGSPFTLQQLAGATKNVSGDIVKFRFLTDARRNDYGFKVTGISAGVGSASTDLTVTKTHNGNFSQGQTGATYTLVVKNLGGAASSGQVTVTDNLPAGLTATNISGSGWNCAQPSGPCSRADALGAGASYPPITLTVNVAQSAPNLVTNTATVTGGGDTNPSNNNVGDSTTISAVGCGVLPESPHPYPGNYDNTWTCVLGGAFTSVQVTFDAATSIDPTDQLFITDVNGINIAGSPFTGASLAGQTITVPGNGVKIRLVTDSRRADYGFRVTGVVGVP